ncbi:hypothetical protein DFS34DRAFT_204274 [Phlyctochytrium arcticum]|nr:hypothetical protein DFS34DRAFT_204274 [Phlyctochytrium arcticum]
MLDKLYRTIYSISSLVVVLLVSIAVLGLCGLDIFLRIYENRVLLVSAGSSVCLLVVASLLIVSSRKLSIRSALQDIPKRYVPINRTDVPKRVYQLIQADLSKVANIASSAKPRAIDAPDIGWGQPDTEFEGVHYRTAAIQSFEILESAVTQYHQALHRTAPTTVRRYIELLVCEGLVRSDVGQAYTDRYERVRYGHDEMTMQEYVDFMRSFALVLREVERAAAIHFGG